MRFRDETRNRDVEVNLTPLIDVVFLLLIFFMVTTTFRQETKLQIELPESSSEQSLSQTDNTLQVEINADGKFALKGPGEKKSRSLVSDDEDTLKRAINKLVQGKDDVDVVLMADRMTPYQAVARAMDVCRQLGLVNFNLATAQHSK